MAIPARIRELAGWPGWRRYGPAAGSAVAHGVVGLMVASLLTAASKPLPPARAVPPQPALELVLLADETPPPQGVRPPPDPRRPTPPPDETPTKPDAPPIDLPRKDQQAGKQPTVADTTAPDGSVFLPPPPVSNYNGPAGLRGLVEGDPCAVKPGQKPGKDCAGVNWASRLDLGIEDTLIPRTKDQVAAFYPEFATKCRWRTGCDGGEWLSSNDTRSVFSPSGSPMMSGAGGIRDGPGSTVGRLPVNPDHIDPGFGD